MLLNGRLMFCCFCCFLRHFIVSSYGWDYLFVHWYSIWVLWVLFFFLFFPFFFNTSFLLTWMFEHDCLDTWGQYHGDQRPSCDDSYHSQTVIPPSTLNKPSIMKHYHRRRMTSWGVTAHSLTMVTLHDTQFVECRWWNDSWAVKTVVTWRSSVSMIWAPGFLGVLHACFFWGGRGLYFCICSANWACFTWIGALEIRSLLLLVVVVLLLLWLLLSLI